MNLVILSGRVASAPEAQHTTNSKVTHFRLITTDWDGHKEVDETHRITVWGEGAADYIVKHIGVGDLVELKGRIKSSSYEKPGEGKKYSYEIVVDGRVTRLSQAQRNRA